MKGASVLSEFNSGKERKGNVVNCIKCERPAHGICRFCGRALCKEHFQTMPYVITAFNEKEKVKLIVVEDAFFCGICKPKEEPVDLEIK